MAWTTPKTWVGNVAPTVLEFNTHIRDNMLEMSLPIATTVGSYFVADAAHSLTQRKMTSAKVATSNAWSLTTYGDLTTPGPAVTVTTGVFAFTFIAARGENNGANESIMSYGITGATTSVEVDNRSMKIAGVTAANFIRQCAAFSHTLTAGSNTFTCKYRVTGGTGTWQDRFIAVLPL